MTRALIALIALLGLSACAEGYTYVYDYDPYLGPRGHYVRPFKAAPASACRVVAYAPQLDRQIDPWRGAYESGPYCADGAVGAPGAAP